MDLDRSRQSRRQSFKQPLDRRVDNWIETGLQFVDGVAGNRPGRRAISSRLSGASFEKVGRWVGDKVDWFLEDEESWLEPWQSDTQIPSSNTKRPLEAISRRVSKQISSSSKYSQGTCEADEWPEDSTFRVERWRRSSSEVNQSVDSEKLPNSRRDSISFERRSLPRSSRRRD